MKENIPNLLRYTEICDRLSVGRTTIHRWMADTENPFPQPIYVQGCALFLENDVAAWINNNTRAKY